jgi:hypothetical protein
MRYAVVELSHNEISLLLFALEGGDAAELPDPASCEEACPVIESVEELLCGGQLDPKQQLVRHLNNHLREGLIESGMFELMASTNGGSTQSVEVQSSLLRANERLAGWTCKVKLDDEELRRLFECVSRLPRSSWIAMPRTIWRLRRKLRRA